MPSHVDEALSKGMGVVKKGKATIEGMSGVFKTLMEQHGEVSAMLHRVQGDDEKGKELWPTIRKELLSHERGELREVYPVLKQHPETRDFAEQHDREARQLEDAIERIDAAPLGTKEWSDQFSALVKLVQDHVEEEESKIFPKAQDVIGKDRAKELDDRFLAAKKAVMEAV